ncbi:anthranilate synthase component II [Haoranjiania flava]|uniref:Aminodeoxychorismate/anthranilate synthase component II n=1 Tax=Haoranjiania flava TaxID=1856322 RepID=A0AAE3IJR0_9BACT|nr:aminodeoxychorismate/anthranilate synthase component II [Haoranjiania flava]MCU7693367.1 aminodeoxychorismate/anthranilate synthase component II [Haoranjiania flava]
MQTKILIIDHNDSFTFNLVQLFEEIQDVEVNVLNVGNFDLNMCSSYDAIVLSPGPGLPQDYPAVYELLKKFYTLKPILGICLGLQHIVHFFGGALYNLDSVQHGKQSAIFLLAEDVLFKNIQQPVLAGLYHSWAAAKNKFPDCLEITSQTAEGVVMALRHKKYPISAVQFHPESYMTPNGKQMLENWVKVL